MPHMIYDQNNSQRRFLNEWEMYENDREKYKKRLTRETPFCGRFTRSPCIMCAVCLLLAIISIVLIFLGVFMSKPGNLSSDPTYYMAYFGIVFLCIAFGLLLISGIWISRLRSRHIRNELRRKYPKLPNGGQQQAFLVLPPESTMDDLHSEDATQFVAYDYNSSIGGAGAGGDEEDFVGNNYNYKNDKEIIYVDPDSLQQSHSIKMSSFRNHYVDPSSHAPPPQRGSSGNHHHYTVPLVVPNTTNTNTNATGGRNSAQLNKVKFQDNQNGYVSPRREDVI